MAARILVIDRDPSVRSAICDGLTEKGHETISAEDGRAAKERLHGAVFNLVIVDPRLPDMDGLALLRDIRSYSAETAIVVLTTCPNIEHVVNIMKAGAAEFLAKPLVWDELLAAVQRVLEEQERNHGTRNGASTPDTQRQGLAGIVGDSASMATVKDLARRVARSGATTVLLLGESGTGKDMFAKAIHWESPRRESPFITVTCTAIPETLLESELFGHERGAFTDAYAPKQGLFELAHGGTLFLDEIGDMARSLQAKLLRVLEDGTFKRVGGTFDMQADVRIIAATNQNIARAIREGHFREDLYYRLSTVPIAIPPLRERPGDIPLLVNYFLRLYSGGITGTPRTVSSEAMALLSMHPWPGNVRELRNSVERALLLAPTDVIASDDIVLNSVPEQDGEADAGQPFRLPVDGCLLANVERSLIQQALERATGNQTRAAALIGVTREQLRHRMKKYGLL